MNTPTENLKPHLSAKLKRIPAQLLLEFQKLLPNPDEYQKEHKVFSVVIPTYITDKVTVLGNPKFPKDDKIEEQSEWIQFTKREIAGKMVWVFEGEVVL